jgi:hypothetical protein
MRDHEPPAGGDTSKDTVRRKSTAGGPSLPYAKAFVVQFTAETDPGLEHAAGRIEHLQTGRRERFESADDLLLWIAALLPRPPDDAGHPGVDPHS